MKNRRLLRRTLGGAAIAGAVLLLFLQFGLGFAVKHGAQTVGSALLGCDVAITNCHMRLLSGVVDMRGVVVGPPEGFDANLFEMDRLHVEFSPRSVFGAGPLLIREIAVTNVLVTYEIKGIDSNISAVTKKLGVEEEEEPAEEKDGDEAADEDDGGETGEKDGDAEETESEEAGDADETTDEEAEKSDEEAGGADEGGKKVVIDHFVFSGAKVRAAFWDGKGIKPPLPAIELTDIGKKSGGATVLEAVGSVFGSIGRGVLGLVASVGGLVVDAAVGTAEAVGDAAEAVGDAAVDAAEAVGDAAEAAGDAIGGLFGGDD